MEKETVIYAERAKKILPAGNGGYTAVFEQMTDSFKARYLKALGEKYTLEYTADFDGDYVLCKNHFETYVSDDETVHFSYHAYNGRAYVTYLPRVDGWVLPTRQAPAFARIGDDYPTIMTDVGTERFHPTESANCQIVRLADGSFVILDSAYGNRDQTEDLIYDILKKQAPDPDHIVIAAWLFTHAHADHVGGFHYFADKYAGKGDIELRQVVCNFPDDSVLNTCDSNMQKRTIDAAKRLNENVTFIKAHIGDVLYYGDVKIEILYTQEQMLAVSDFLGDYNATSCVYRLITEDGVTYLCGGDHNVNNQHAPYYGCEGALYRWYGSFIESDIVGAFHHGYGGGADTRIYSFVKPRLVLWNVSWSCVKKSSLLQFSVNLYFSEPENAKRHNVRSIISGDTIHVFHFNNGAFTVTEYETADEYFNS